MNEEDSRSNEGSGSQTSPRISKKTTVANNVVVKIEGRRNSPNSCDRKIGIRKVSPSPSHSKDIGIGINSIENISTKSSPKSTPGTPVIPTGPLSEYYAIFKISTLLKKK